MILASMHRMSIVTLLLLLVIAGVCGAIGKAIAGSGTGGFVVSIILGFIGAFFGTWLARELELPMFFTVNVNGEVFPVVWSILGAAIVVALVSIVARRRHYA
jgi:uncharacterized membrane protein YeaQ/YmgE (transglycosylase-associated protein family)